MRFVANYRLARTAILVTSYLMFWHWQKCTPYKLIF